jgi:hypothetical protein
MTEFSLPEDPTNYIYTVKDRCMDLISHDIWVGIKPINLNRWFNNFETELEKYFAACILDALIYRSDDQMTALANELFTKKLPLLLNSKSYNFTDYKELTDLLKSDVTNQMRLVSVSSNQERPVKSSNVILRDFRRKMYFNDSWFITPNEVEREKDNGIKTFIFIDDFLGTGNQFDSMWKNNGFGLTLKDCNAIYAPLVAHLEGVKMLTDKYENLFVISAEYLDETSNVFNFAFNDGINTPENAKLFYDSLLKKYNFNKLLPENNYGYGNLGLAYTFYHSSPDNCLHIIWDNKDGWHPLITK